MAFKYKTTADVASDTAGMNSNQKSDYYAGVQTDFAASEVADWLDYSERMDHPNVLKALAVEKETHQRLHGDTSRIRDWDAKLRSIQGAT